MVNQEQEPAPVLVPRRRKPPAPIPATATTSSAAAPPAPAPSEAARPTQEPAPVLVPRRRKPPAPIPATATTPGSTQPEPAPFVPSISEPAPVTALPPRVGPVLPPGHRDALRAGRTTPAERFDPSTAWSMTDLASACPDPMLDASQRLDPYWGGIWTGGSTATWYSRPQVEMRLDAGVMRTWPQQFRVDPGEALDRFRHRQDRLAKISFLSVLHAWRTVTAEQAACFAGARSLLRPYYPTTASAVASHLVDIGLLDATTGPWKWNDRTCVYRPSKSNVFTEAIEPHLTYAEWVAVTGGQGWDRGGHYDRHNLLASELALRAAEYADVATVLGERFSTIDMLAGSGAGLEPIPGDQRAADTTLVRRDGLRVAIEVTATSARSLASKARRWARLLAERPLEDTGLCVVFLVAPVPGDDQWTDASVRAKTYEAVLAAVREYPGVSADRVAERIGVATWREWFPGHGLISDNFLGLRVDRPTGAKDAPWESCELFDVTDRPFAPLDPARLAAVVANASLLGQTPYWLRTEPDGAAPLRALLVEAGFGEIPHPSPAKPERIRGDGRRLGQGIGAVGDARPPARLLGLASPTTSTSKESR